MGTTQIKRQTCTEKCVLMSHDGTANNVFNMCGYKYSRLRLLYTLSVNRESREETMFRNPFHICCLYVGYCYHNCTLLQKELHFRYSMLNDAVHKSPVPAGTSWHHIVINMCWNRVFPQATENFLQLTYRWSTRESSRLPRTIGASASCHLCFSSCWC